MNIDTICNIIFSSLTLISTIVAIVISIISINRQTKATNLQASLNLYKLRLDVYIYSLNIWKLIGSFVFYIETKKLEVSQSSLIELSQSQNVLIELRPKIQEAIDDNLYYTSQINLLFQPPLANYLRKQFDNFHEFALNYLYPQNQNTSFKDSYINLMELYEQKEIDVYWDNYLKYSSYKIPKNKKNG